MQGFFHPQITLLIIQNFHSSSILNLGFILFKVCMCHFDKISEVIQHCTNFTTTIINFFFQLNPSMQHWAFMWMPITCNDDTQLLIQSTCQSCYINAFRMLYLGHTFGRLWLKAEHGAHEQTRLLSILGSGPLYHRFFFAFLLLFF